MKRVRKKKEDEGRGVKSSEKVHGRVEIVQEQDQEKGYKKRYDY